MAFGPLVISGLEILGIETTREEKDAYMHCWKIVGHFIGLDENLFPDNHEDGWDLGVAIIKRNYGESNDAKILAKSIVGFGQHIMPFPFFNDMPEYFIQRFTRDVSAVVGADFSRLLDIKSKPNLKKRIITWSLERTFDSLSDLKKTSWFFSKIAKWLNSKMLQRTVHFYLKNNKIEFYIPPSLKENWKLN